MQFGKLAIAKVSKAQFVEVDSSDLDFTNHVTIPLVQGRSIWPSWDIENGLNRSQKAIDKLIAKALENGCTHIQFVRK